MPKEDIQQLDSPDSESLSFEKRASRPRTEWEILIKSRRFILLILFLVTGALGLPLLWISSRFSTTEKVFWSTINILYTLAMIAVVVAICMWSYSRILDAL